MHIIKKQAYQTKKQPEQGIEGLLSGLLDLYGRLRKQALIAAAAIVAALVLFGGYSLYQNGNERKASALLAPALAAYNAGQADPGKAIELFRGVHTAYPRTLSGGLALYFEGNCLMGLGRMEEAVERYREAIQRLDGDKNLSGMAEQRMGYAYKAMGNTGEAIKAFERADLLRGPGMATMELAKLYSQAGRPEDARKKYQALAEGLSGAEISEEAKRVIQGQGSPKPGQNKKETK